MTKLFTFIFITVITSLASADSACFASEINVLTKKPFSKDDWLQANQQWQDSEPEAPGILEVIGAWHTYKTELSKTKKMKSDKLKHCYMGCVIAKNTSYKAAVYAAWYKEKTDLNDCDKTSFFEVKDYESTVFGSELANSAKSSMDCQSLCQEHF
ncbi:MAG: hypothetical protein H6623_01370 [Bdellovibrionaceae bacterium]|nr:hypothetical protein [Pseudobdellovibrionaceae bacterium]